VHDHASLAILAAAQGATASREVSGTAIRDNVRRVCQGDGEKVDNVADGLRLITAGRPVNFEGASGPCEFDERGDIRGTKFRYDQAEGGRFRMLELA
jgi:branched-chain amino acid transport system substrate-binding protein